MASPNLHDHHLNCCISSHDWINQSPNCNSNFNEFLRESFIQNQKELTELPTLNPSLSQLMVQDVGFHGSIQDNYHINQELECLPKIKEVITQETLPRLYGAIHDHYQINIIDEKLLARALHNSTHNLLLPSTEDFFNGYANFANGGNVDNMVLPSVNTSTSFVPLPGALNMDLHAFDLLTASRFSCVREDATFGPTSLMQELLQGTCTDQPEIPSFLSGVAEKRALTNCILDNKTSHQATPRKSRFEPCSPSFSSFKVRKEKLGDRIAALQQLVAPFGKTDTASVLMEVIGYIKFLQDQVETLSVPYLRSSKKQKTTQGEASEEKGESKLDLRSRGLCLVPLSCTSYVTNENGGVWSCPNFRGDL